MTKRRCKVRIKLGWSGAGRCGYILGAQVKVGDQLWTPVLWDGEDDPDWHKSAGLVILGGMNDGA